MAGSVSNTKSYSIGPQDGWFEILDATTTPMFLLRISAVPHVHQFQVYSGTTAPASNQVTGVLNCHHPFKVANFTSAGNSSKFWVRITNPLPDAPNGDGRVRIDVYADGGTLQ